MSSNTATNKNEQRQETRVDVNLQEQKHRFFIEFADQTIPINNMHNVSVSGVGIEVEEMIAQGETIVLGYQFDNMDLKVQGTVAWCDGSDNTTTLGIEFSTDIPNDNMLFFMAMRKYLDTFDGITTKDA